MTNASLHSQSIKYRPDVDGLRALAVIAVLIFHFFPSTFRGGFVGVDVFFVISGYLVTSIIYNDIQKSRFSFLQFYVKRVKRLFPSLIAVLLCCITAGYYLLTAEELKNLGLHVIAGSAFVENFLLYSQSGYFDKSSHLKPLLHLWSLSIEEQFYLIWPVIIYFGFKKNASILGKVLFFIFAASLILNLTLTHNHQSFSFYMIVTRLWELAFGGMIFLAESNGKLKSQLDQMIAKLERFKITPSSVGLILILISFLVITESKKFPGFWVLLPVIGTGLIIINNKYKVNQFFSKKTLVYIGLISYPLYLWHWPLISFANIASPTDPSIALRLALMALSFVLAMISYEWIEKPVRLSPYPIKTPVLLGVLMVFLAFFGFVLHDKNGYPERYPLVETARESKIPFVATQNEDEKNWKACTEKTINIELCAISKPDQPPTVLIIGDSHSLHLFPGLKNAFDQKNENLLLLAKSGTPAFYNIASKRSPDVNQNDVFEYLIKTPSIHTVVLAGFWGNYAEELGVHIAGHPYKNIIEDITNPRIKNQKDVFRIGLDRTITFLKQHGKRVVFFHDVPPLPFYLDKCLPRPLSNPESKCDFSKADALASQANYRSVASAVLQKNPQIPIFDPLEKVCSQEECSIWKDDKVLYSDEHHLSIYGSGYVIESLGF